MQQFHYNLQGDWLDNIIMMLNMQNILFTNNVKKKKKHVAWAIWKMKTSCRTQIIA